MEKSAIESVIEVLQKDKFYEEASNLENLSEILYSNNSKEVLMAANEIQGLCHIRALGDLAIKSMSGWEWNSLLEKAQILASKRIKKLSEHS